MRMASGMMLGLPHSKALACNHDQKGAEMTTDETAPGGDKPSPLPFDTTKAHQARGYDYLLGSKGEVLHTR